MFRAFDTEAADNAGNLTSEPQSAKTYGYSSENLLTSASGGVTLAYDPALRLYQTVGATTTRFLYDGVDAIAEYNGFNALQRRFVFDPTSGQPVLWYEGTGTAASNRRYLSEDERGSIVSVSGSTGTSLGLNRYDEYGKPGSANLGRYQYTGQKWLPEANLYDYHFRDYLPHLGIFAQTDPIGQEDSPNLYAYVLDDPVNRVDPFGLFTCPPGYDISRLPSSAPAGTGAEGSVIVTAQVTCVWRMETYAPIGMSGGGGGGGGGGGDADADVKKSTPCEAVLKLANRLKSAGSRIQDFGAGATAAGLTGDAIALAFPPAEIGTASLTAAGGAITLGGTLVSGAGDVLEFGATRDWGQAALNGVSLVAGFIKSSNKAHEFLKGLNLDKAIDVAQAFAPAKCK